MDLNNLFTLAAEQLRSDDVQIADKMITQNLHQNLKQVLKEINDKDWMFDPRIGCLEKKCWILYP
jgi:hypothetical protein